jgi:hypothetical protein
LSKNAQGLLHELKLSKADADADADESDTPSLAA